jgi:hypothetical protein
LADSAEAGAITHTLAIRKATMRNIVRLRDGPCSTTVPAFRPNCDAPDKKQARHDGRA